MGQRIIFPFHGPQKELFYPYKDGLENSLFSKGQPHCPQGMEQDIAWADSSAWHCPRCRKILLEYGSDPRYFEK